MERPLTFAATRSSALLAALLVFAALLLRLSVCFNDLWLDEIWSLTFARRATSAADLLFRIHHDNNHKLNTLFMYVLGQEVPGFVYRLPSLVAGVGAVILAGWIARGHGKLPALLAIYLTSFSYLLVHYSSEARGYSLALLSAFVSYLCLGRFLETRRLAFALFFGVGVMLGLLAHLTCLQFYIGALVWSAVRIWRRGPRGWRGLRAFAACHFLPLAFLVLLYLVDLRWTVIGGGDARPFPQVIANAAALAVGGPPGRPVTALAALGVALLFSGGLLALWRQGSDRWIFFVVTVLLAPGLLLSLHGGAVFERYFLIAAAFMLLPAGVALAGIYRRGRVAKVACALALLCILAGNLSLVFRLQRDGRGAYLEALQFIAARTRGGTITIGSDHDFRNTLLLDYYSRYLPGKRIVYFAVGSWPKDGPEWFIVHSQSQTELPAHRLEIAEVQYVLVKVSRSSPVSGWNWYIYHQPEGPTAAPSSQEPPAGEGHDG